MVIFSEFDLAKEILEKIKGGHLGNEFSARDIYRKHWKRLSKPESVKKGLEILVDYGYLIDFDIQDGGRPTRGYSIHSSLRK